MHRQHSRRDARIKKTAALPASAGSTATAVIDTGFDKSKGHQAGNFEFEIVAPALTVTELPNSATAKYALMASANSDKSSPVTVVADIISQLGAGGAGDDTETAYYRPQSDALRYFWLSCTTATSPGDCSGKSMSLDILF